MKKVLVLGAGLVSRPMVEYLLKKDISVCVATRTVSKAEELIRGHKNGQAVSWLTENVDALKKMVRESEVIVSLLPYTYHLAVAQICLEYRKHLVTTSYVKPEMQALHEKAKQARIIILNEIGLDPGIDHMSAMRTIDKIKAGKGKITSFRSTCGALPAPEASNNPFKYKFGWSPRGVCLAGRNDGKYKDNGKIVSVPGPDLFKHYYRTEINPIGTMEIYPNRDSLPYLDLYSIRDAQTIYRGTIRYPEWCDLWYVISNLGFLDTQEKEFKGTYRDYTRSVLGLKNDDIEGFIAKKFKLAADSPILTKLEWLGLFSDDPLRPQKGGNIDPLVDRLLEKLKYENGERDMVILQDETIAAYGKKKVKYLSTLIDYGVMGEDTSVARTVSLPAACAVRMLLEGKITETGVHIPVLPNIYNPVLDELATLGIECKEEETEL